MSKEQAKEVLRLTDQFFVELIGSMARNEEIDYSLERSLFEEQFLWVDHFCNWIFQNNHSPKYMGWMWPDGMVGGNGLMDRYPELNEVLDACGMLTKNFPFLDFVVAITDHNDVPEEEWILDDDDEREVCPMNFDEEIVILFRVHDHHIEILEGAEAVRRYHEYADEFTPEEELRCGAYYCERNNIQPCDREYLLDCLTRYGVEPEKVLKAVPEYVIEDYLIKEQR